MNSNKIVSLDQSEIEEVGGGFLVLLLAHPFVAGAVVGAGIYLATEYLN